MDRLKTLLIIFGLSVFSMTYAQEGKSSYYEQRAKEDAKIEQEFQAESKDQEKEFWDDQKQYEKDLKKRDKEACRAYMRGKKDAYAEHQEHCNDHHHHSDYYYRNASFYYHDYHYYNQPRRSTIGTSVRLSTPRVKIGLL